MKIKVVLEPSEEGGYTTYVPSLPGCISEGDTKEEALADIREAIALFWSLSRMTKYLPRRPRLSSCRCESGSQPFLPRDRPCPPAKWMGVRQSNAPPSGKS